ncbi:MAG: tRNA (adenosine(37)-N6)-threonylcarbamoyltransferase complex ATPase subunit type 1 TsaE [Candidatus Zixiibacteriota bacterium]
MKVLKVISHSEDETVALGRRLAASFDSGDVIILRGELGSGKTTFVRALVAARGIDERLVTSPSYTFVNEYPGDPPIYHLDLYRMGDVSELTEIGWDDFLSRDGIVIVEWGERADYRLPSRYYLAEFSIIDEEQRQISFSLVQS